MAEKSLGFSPCGMILGNKLIPSAAKAGTNGMRVAARLKPCPDTSC